jgi:mycofactocin precursor
MTERATSSTTTVSPPRDQDRTTGAEVNTPVLVEEDLLVEDVSIDGMCGVY